MIAGQLLTRPQAKPGAIIDGVNLDYHVRIRERYRAWRPCARRRVDNGIIEQPLGLLRSQLVYCPAPAQSHVK